MQHIMNNETLYIKSQIDGQLITVTGIFTTASETNKYLKKETKESVIAVYGKFIFTAKDNDFGRSLI